MRGMLLGGNGEIGPFGSNIIKGLFGDGVTGNTSDFGSDFEGSNPSPRACVLIGLLL